MSKSLLLRSLDNFEGASLIDDIHLTYIDLNSDPAIGDIEIFLKNAQTYLEKDLPLEIAIELFITITTCFSKFPNEMLPNYEEYFQKARTNSNYIIVNSSILFELVHLNLQLDLPNYHSFVDDALQAISAHNINESNLIIFNHKIPPQFINDLLLNLILLSDLTAKLVSDFFPYIFSHFLFSDNSKFELLIQNISKTDIVQILPQTDQSNQEIIDFITKYDDRSDLILQICPASLSLIEFSVIFYQSKGQIKINGLTENNILQFLAIFLIYDQRKGINFVYSGDDFSSLFLNATNFLNEKPSPVSKKSLDFILTNYKGLLQHNLISQEALNQTIENLLKSGYSSEKAALLTAAVEISNKKGKLNITDIFQYFTKNIPEAVKNLDVALFNINQIDSNLIIQHLKELKTTAEIDQFFFFIDHLCEYRHELMVKISPSLIDLIKVKIKEGKKEDAFIIERFMKKNDLSEKLKEVKEIISELHFDTIDDILSQILNDIHPEQNDALIEALFNKMVEDKELRISYLSCYVFKYGRVYHQLSDYEKLFTDTYKKFGEDFITATNKVFYYQNIRKIMLTRPDFKVSSLPISESGLSIISKLYDLIEKNPCENYQAFFCLKSIACTFPFLFAKEPQKIIDIVLPSFDNFSLVFDKSQINEKSEKIMKTSFSALEFLFSTLHSTFVFDHFIKFLFKNIESLSNSQVYALITLLQLIYKENFISTYFQAFVLKFDFLNTISNLLERDVKEEYFEEEYKRNLYSFVLETYKILLNINKVDSIYFDLLNEAEFPVHNIFEKLYMKIPFCFEVKNLNYNVDLQLKTFIDDIHRSRTFWLNTESQKRKVFDLEIDEIMKDFDQKLEKHSPLPPGGDRPIFNYEVTIKIIKYFFDKPSFLFSWCINGNIFPVVEEIYQLILDTLKDLNELNDNKNYDDPDDDNYKSVCLIDKALPFYCQENLFKGIVNRITDLKVPNSIQSYLNDIVPCISKFGCALMSFFDLFSQKVDEFHHDKIDSRILLVLNVLFNCRDLPAFENNFVDMCGNKLLNICLSPICRSNSSVIAKMVSLLSKSASIPNNSIYLVPFLLWQDDVDFILIGIEFLSKINPKNQEMINSVILNAFDNQFNKDDQQKSVIKLLADKCPSIINERKRQLVELLNTYLDLYFADEKEDEKKEKRRNQNEEEEEEEEESSEKVDQIQFIGFLFSKLAPSRGKSLSLLAAADDSSEIPREIMETNPHFWKVFEKYQKKILSKIEKKPSLLNHFNFLIEYPEIVNFKIRSAYFSRKMKAKINKYENLRIHVNKNDLLSTSFRQLHSKSSSLFLNKFYVIVDGEGGNTTIDAGGPTRQWFTKLAREIFNPNYGLFQCTKKFNFFPSPNSNIHPNHLEYFRFAGRFVARAIIEGVCIDAHFTSSFCKQILHREANMNDLADIDDELFTNFEFTLSNEKVEQQDMVFIVDRDEFGNVASIPLKENGENIAVTNENKKEFVDLYVDFILRKEIEKQINEFCLGFNELIPHNEIKMFTSNELDMIICGIDSIDVNDFIAHTIFEHPYTKDSPVIKMFFNVIRKWDNEKLAKLLFFMTGATHLPPNGFAGFCESSGHLMKIQAGGKPTDLPQGHTCFNTIDLPQYENEEIMNEKLLIAIYECDSITNY